MTCLYSARNKPLVWRGGHPAVGGVLTMECYCKWYEMFIVHTDKILSVGFDVLADSRFCKHELPFCDHVPNPRAVHRYAAANGYQLDNEAFEMIIGRWELEYRDNYDVEREDQEIAR